MTLVVTRIDLDYRGIGELMREPGIRAALHDRAEVIASRARQLATAERLKAEIEVTDGTRPRGRPYSQVSAEHPDGGWGGTDTQRTDLLIEAVEQTGGSRG